MGRALYNQLSARRVASLAEPGRYGDGLGLMLMIDAAGNKRWVLRVTVNGKRRDLGLGSAREVTLAEARERRDEIRKAMRGGVDPIAARAKKKQIPTFEAFAAELHKSIKSDWKNPKHADQWLSTLKAYAFPTLGKMKIDAVDSLAVKAALAPVWTAKPETARRVKQRIRRVLSAAIAEGFRPGPNPADDATAGLPKKRAKRKHFEAMPYADVPAFMERIAVSEMTPTGRGAFQLLILTATRTSEVLKATWGEINEADALWIIPPARMKKGAEHRVPLSPPALAILAEMRKHSDDSPLIFPGQGQGKPFSNMVFLAAMRRMGETATPHGFRSAFRDWAEEQTSFPREVKESALAHKVRDATEAAYLRTTLVEKRRTLMNEWADYVAGRGEK